ncbi:membrane protein [Methanocalculus chunghsingensis]|uniref:Membrane protein n=1 Tax=Methanocalculus chunghsingensis TaxID=156457 RepID=A0A8J7WAQ2_9EURY|nr:iron chelate uptake ABC transporter family permease subunit [Methanocalculus chunghsingensis]MBR1369497.1 membrane protein [Methanocalculus chunghsingensis]
MFEILGYGFFQNAIIAGIIAAIACGITGSFVIVRRMVATSGGISHAAFGGVGLGYFLGIDPLLGAFLFTVGAAVAIWYLKTHELQETDTITGALWATGMATGVIFIALTPGYAPDLFSYLFGNILLVPYQDLLMMGLLLLLILTVVSIFFNQLAAVTFDEEYAEIMGLPVGGLTLLLFLLIAGTVVLLISVVGIILVIALLTLPAATARLFTRTLPSMMGAAVLIGIGTVFTGIILSYSLDLPSGAMIILVGAGIYAAALAGRHFSG